METDRQKNTEREAGASIIEFLVALIIATIVIVAILRTAASSVQSSEAAQKLGDVNSLASKKASELIKTANELASQIPKNARRAGSIFPAPATAGFFDELDEKGEPISPTSSSPIRYERQWLIAKDRPSKNNVTVYVSLVQKEAGRRKILRVVKASKIDGLTVRTNSSESQQAQR